MFACPGKNNGLQNFNLRPSIKAVCEGGKKLRVDKISHEISDFTCKKLPYVTVKESQTPCLKKYQKYEIGYNVESTFLNIITVCRDEKTLRTLYSQSKLVKELAGSPHKFPRPFWNPGPYFQGYNIKSIYKPSAQIDSLEYQLGSRDLAERYIRPQDAQFLNRGHLTAKADLVLGAHQKATFWLINTAPQWVSFNAGNWQMVERSVRSYSISRNLNLDEYTGVHGITTLEDVNGNQQPLYLHANATHSAFPVPRFFWKIVHDPISKRGLAIIGLNEPYAKQITKDMYICPNIVGQNEVEWVKAKFDNIKNGITYVCSVESLRKAVPTIPEFKVSGILS